MSVFQKVVAVIIIAAYIIFALGITLDRETEEGEAACAVLFLIGGIFLIILIRYIVEFILGMIALVLQIMFLMFIYYIMGGEFR